MLVHINRLKLLLALVLIFVGSNSVFTIDIFLQEKIVWTTVPWGPQSQTVGPKNNFVSLWIGITTDFKMMKFNWFSYQKLRFELSTATKKSWFQRFFCFFSTFMRTIFWYIIERGWIFFSGYGPLRKNEWLSRWWQIFWVLTNLWSKNHNSKHSHGYLN